MTTPCAPAIRLTVFHRLCAWCGCDLGILEHHCENHSYGICPSCAHQYFADLYAIEIVAASPNAAHERSVGAYTETQS
jgi:hypothetical protein